MLFCLVRSRRCPAQQGSKIVGVASAAIAINLINVLDFIFSSYSYEGDCRWLVAVSLVKLGEKSAAKAEAGDSELLSASASLVMGRANG